MTDHISFDQLCDVADGVVPAPEGSRLRHHLNTCRECARQLASLSALDISTAALPAAIAPPDDFWGDIRGRLQPRLSVGAAPRRTWRGLLAAGLIIAVASSALTVLAVRARQSSGGGVTSAQVAQLPAQLASDERSYAQSVALLQRTLDERRDSLSASTVATVERSLRIADSAIAEARTALAQDPSNRALARLFASNYARKIDLLRRATELSPRT